MAKPNFPIEVVVQHDGPIKLFEPGLSNRNLALLHATTRGKMATNVPEVTAIGQEVLMGADFSARGCPAVWVISAYDLENLIEAARGGVLA